MRILSFNVNGIRACVKHGMLEWLKKDAPDILCIQESKVNAPQAFLEFPYKTYWSFAEKKGYSGVAIFTKTAPLKVERKIGFEKFDKEGRVLILEFEKFVLFNLYFPHGGREKENLSYKLDCYKHFLSYVTTFSKPVVLCGDFNIACEEIDLARPKDNKNNIMFTDDEREMLNRLIESGFVDSFRIFNKEGGNYSWWPYRNSLRERNIGWRIDYSFVSKDLASKVVSAFILHSVKGSDHCPVGLELEIPQ